MEDLRGKVAVITGGASGIGRAVAERAAAEGMKVVLGDIEEGPLKEAEHELTAQGAEALGVVTDVADVVSVRALRDRALDRFGAVHVVHNNAGVGLGGPIWEVSEEDWRWILGVNLWGVVHGVATFVPLFIAQGEGHVVNTASIAGLTTTRPSKPSSPSPRRCSRTSRPSVRPSASPSCAPASCRHASPSPTGTARPGRPNTRSAGRRSCGAPCRAWSTPASRPQWWPTASSTPCAPTPSTS
jgi:NAD(P)-dependent dehydrogenase (short-subunit alcohol dehydrogenase family)